MPSMVQFEHFALPSGVVWKFCITLHLTFLDRHLTQALSALLFVSVLEITRASVRGLESNAVVEMEFRELEQSDAGDLLEVPMSR